jgi:hypothetical protein
LPDFRPGVASFFLGGVRPLRINWLVVGMRIGSVAGGRIPAVSIVWRHSHPNYAAATPSASSTDTTVSPTASATGA